MWRHEHVINNRRRISKWDYLQTVIGQAKKYYVGFVENLIFFQTVQKL